MPNILPGEIPGENAREISHFFGEIQSNYGKFFNLKKGKRGQVFEGRFCVKEIPDQKYLFTVKQYIEWNAVKHEIVKQPEDWLYSSYSKNSKDTYLVDEKEFAELLLE